ncbi:MAG: tRNA (adenosine(37)-N6)-threonylcarbamoyltransferase complex ATPase subunit type 1 TsaE [Smithellaceae bacterium]|nr:tRNA (adenosine(37)-N6)-threonylcarbamoyltransferase complex ATPase subunit type 1 TsaE [Smithellaceae bacterium]
MCQLALTSRSPLQTEKFGEILGKHLGRGDVVALVGEMGAGKTCMTAGIARGLGVDAAYPITSPTFTLINEYPGRRRLIHMDTYRLATGADLDDTGFEEYLQRDGVLVIEWAEKVKDDLPPEAIWIELRIIDENTREIVVTGGPERLSAELRKI